MLFHLVFLKIVTTPTNQTPANFYKMTQVELSESVFAKLAENVEFMPESEETMELGIFIVVYLY